MLLLQVFVRSDIWVLYASGFNANLPARDGENRAVAQQGTSFKIVCGDRLLQGNECVSTLQQGITLIRLPPPRQQQDHFPIEIDEEVSCEGGEPSMPNVSLNLDNKRNVATPASMPNVSVWPFLCCCGRLTHCRV
ncbi:hypothetical protein AK812_SmicGene39732 [Symbiodinium microadriaticum]|uniref:Uncharacterized protein n=1 Tax=Symbiodinium microadriaticum TaxID=2951 RepID=A0A1Q9CAH6_SYMMI|nr:hypothetical protein AK812_SmicGene39732 [Symbiodinium microadriaticum]